MSQSSHKREREKYGTLNPAGRVMCSKALERELDQIVLDSRARDFTVVSCGPGKKVTVQLEFHPDDFGELWPWSGWEDSD